MTIPRLVPVSPCIAMSWILGFLGPLSHHSYILLSAAGLSYSSCLAIASLRLTVPRDDSVSPFNPKCRMVSGAPFGRKTGLILASPAFRIKSWGTSRQLTWCCQKQVIIVNASWEDPQLHHLLGTQLVYSLRSSTRHNS